jgi:predicted AlkP superfamily phosphohydrolase/phosphomutase
MKPSRANQAGQRVAVIGLDCVPPSLVFERWREQLPNLRRLMDGGMWGPLRSCHPPITVPAWASMVTGKDPGQLGVYGFRNRRSYGYDDLGLAHSKSSTQPSVWDIASQAGKQVILLGVPQTYPPPLVNGCVVSCFLTPSRAAYTYPAALQEEIDALVPEYVFDVEGFRTTDKTALLARIYDKTRKHFQVARHLVATRPWDFFMMVEMGTDRIHHAFWNHGDPQHPDYDPADSLAPAIGDYYRFLDDEIGALLRLIDDDTVVLVVSDHGARRMEGAIAINEWLQRSGYLALSQTPVRPTALRAELVDWTRTRAWADGGYCGRIYLNVAGREPNGIVDPGDYERTREELIAAVETLADADGCGLGSAAYRPQDIYAETRGIAPDLLVYFGDLAWRAVGSVGHDGIHIAENDTGPDGANHDWDGIVIVNEPSAGARHGRLQECGIMDVAPTILRHLGLPVPGDMRGRVIDAERLVHMSPTPRALVSPQPHAARG